MRIDSCGGNRRGRSQAARGLAGALRWAYLAAELVRELSLVAHELLLPNRQH